MNFDPKSWFESHVTETAQTKLFDKLSEEEKVKLLRILQIEIPEEIFFCSIYDDEHFVLLTEKRLIWFSDGKSNQILYSDLKQFEREGGLSDPRYKKFQWCYYNQGKAIGTNNSDDLKGFYSREHNIRLSSPLVYIEDKFGNYKSFKMEPGHTIESIIVGVDKIRKIQKGKGAN